MTGLLWSTNTALKYRIEHVFQKGRHYAWCSPVFEGAALPRYAVGATQPASSDPCTIYRQLLGAVKSSDSHDAKIASQKKTLRALAREWFKAGSISQDQHDEIIAIVSRASFSDWKPLIYAIPRAPLEGTGRLIDVPRAKRASHEPEFIVADLSETEFSIIEPVQC